MATGVESEMELPFAGLHQLFAPMLDRLGRLPGPQRDAMSTVFGLIKGRAPDRFLIGLAVLSLLSDAAEEAPLLCVVDDAHWLDTASAHALAFAARRLLAEQVGLVFATRHLTEDLRGLPEVTVVGLEDSDSRVLLNSVSGVPLDTRVRDRIIAETHGNPLALLEWPRGLTQADLAGGFGLPKVAMAGQIEESFRRRLGELPPLARRFVTVAAAEPTGDAATVWRAAVELGVGPRDAAPAIEAGLVDVDALVRFRHPTVRTAAYAAATPDHRRAAHRALASVTDPDADPDRRAWHLALAAAGPDEEVAAELERSAGRAQARGGLAAAAALLERSVALTLDRPQGARRTLAAAAAHLEAGAAEKSAALLALAEAGPLDELGTARAELLRGYHAVAWGDARDATISSSAPPSAWSRSTPRAASDTHVAALGTVVNASSLAPGKPSMKRPAPPRRRRCLTPSGPRTCCCTVWQWRSRTVLLPPLQSCGTRSPRSVRQRCRPKKDSDGWASPALPPRSCGTTRVGSCWRLVTSRPPETSVPSPCYPWHSTHWQ